ncbi:hypothetical protein CU097_002195 [Rhizopus azygosporus]|uniref:Uncharacterized protein n=1 Tax=Rhizopus azygosporus TaxID=86630 RepID=A0A367K3U4_RHIAZ|nr:hypothetical protein CU097_002195 [Rhizopus azygosporus]
MVLKMCPVKTSVVNAIRHLAENVPLTTIKQDSTGVAEIWSMFSDPIVRSLINIPDQSVHFCWANMTGAMARQRHTMQQTTTTCWREIC